MGSSGNAEEMQIRIQQARRDAEGLKDRIKRTKDELADTTRACNFFKAPDVELGLCCEPS